MFGLGTILILSKEEELFIGWTDGFVFPLKYKITPVRITRTVTIEIIIEAIAPPFNHIELSLCYFHYHYYH